jgi:SAM-dependent methyltransferase
MSTLTLTKEDEIVKIWQKYLTPKQFTNYLHRHYALTPLISIIDKYAPPEAKLLDIGAGALALPYFLETKGYQGDIMALEFDPVHGKIYNALTDAGILTHTRFAIGDANHLCIKEDVYDIATAKSMLYGPYVNLEDLLQGSYTALKPGGFFCFDVLDKKFAKFSPLYRHFGLAVYDAYRHDMAEVTFMLNRIGFSLVEQRPRLRFKPTQHIIAKLLWLIFKVANGSFFIVQKSS